MEKNSYPPILWIYKKIFVTFVVINYQKIFITRDSINFINAIIREEK